MIIFSIHYPLNKLGLIVAESVSLTLILRIKTKSLVKLRVHLHYNWFSVQIKIIFRHPIAEIWSK